MPNSSKEPTTSRKRKRTIGALPDLPPGAKPGPLFGKMLTAAEQEAREMSRVLTYGRKNKPRAIVVMLHGLTDTADGWHGSHAGGWAKALPGVQIVAPQSPDECGASSPHQPGWSHRGDRHYDWLVQPGIGVDQSDWASCVRTVQTVTEHRILQLNRWLDELLATHGLTNRELILVGFSQGSILATIAGTRRRCRGVVAVGGVPGQPVYDVMEDRYVFGGWMEWRDMIDVGAATETRFCLVNGTNDWCVKRPRTEKLLEGFKHVKWIWDKGYSHTFPEHWFGFALDWLKRALKGV